MAANSDSEVDDEVEVVDFLEVIEKRYPLLVLTKTPKEGKKWRLATLYRQGKGETIYSWTVYFDGKNLNRIYGTMKSPQYTTLEIETNSSGRALHEQAWLQAKRLYIDKIYAGYQTGDASEPPMVKVMKGYVYEGPHSVKDWPVISSYKMDGMRATIQDLGGGNAIARSYLNHEINTIGDIMEQVKKLLVYLPQYTALDGELYNHGMKLYEITAAIKTIKKVHVDIDKISYHIFDLYIIDNPSFEERYKLLKTAYQSCIDDGNDLSRIVLCRHWYSKNHDKLMKDLDKAIAKGYEGLVIRCSGKGAAPGSKKYEMSRYGFNRTKRMHKLKKYLDEEGTVIRVETAKGKEKGLAMMIVKDQFGFEIPLRFGTNDQRKIWYRSPKKIVGKLVTFKHVGRHQESNIAIQPTFVAIRDYE